MSIEGFESGLTGQSVLDGLNKAKTALQDKDLKTINGQSIVGEGDITIEGNKNVQSDWNETNTESDAYIKNKPVIPSEVTEQTVVDWGFIKESYDDTKIKEEIEALEKGLKGKFGVIRMSKNYDSEGYYSLELFSTKEDEALYDSNNDEYASLVTKVKIPISVSPSNFQAELSTTLKEDVNIVFAGEELDIPFIFRAIKVTLVGNENTSYKGTLIVESSSDGVIWAECGRASNSLTSADIEDDTTISIVNIGKYLNVGKKYVRARAAFSFQDNIIESDNIFLGVITKTSAEESSIVLRGIYESGITPDEIHFHNVKWNISAELMMWMADIQVSDITGAIDIEGNILFNDKNKLLARYGNVDDISSSDYKGLKLNYTKVGFDASTATIKGSFFADDLKVYNNEYNTEEEFVFEIQPSSETQNTQTKITYSVEGSGNYTMDANGTFRVRMYELSKAEHTVVVKANVSVIKNGASVVESVSKEIEVWLRPAQVGDLVYADGTFSSAESWDEEKTPIGICFYVPPRDSSGNVLTKFANPNDKQLRLMVALEETRVNINGALTSSLQWGCMPPFSANSDAQYALYDTDSTGKKVDLTSSAVNKVPNVYNIQAVRNLTTRGLDNPYIDPDPTTNENKTASDYRDINSSDGVLNDGFKCITPDMAVGDGFAYNESQISFDSIGERTLTSELAKFAGSGYKENDLVNSGYAKTLKIIAHRNNLLNNDIIGADGEVIYQGGSLPLPSASSSVSEMRALGTLIDQLRTWASQASGLNDPYPTKWQQMAYPFVSACYAYQPTQALQDGEVLADKFKAHNWFAPTEGHLTRICWYAKYGTKGNFDAFKGARDKGLLGTLATTSSYHWSVTEYFSSNSWYVDFGNGHTNLNNKYYSSVGRAVSAF